MQLPHTVFANSEVLICPGWGLSVISNGKNINTAFFFGCWWPFTILKNYSIFCRIIFLFQLGIVLLILKAKLLKSLQKYSCTPIKGCIISLNDSLYKYCLLYISREPRFIWLLSYSQYLKGFCILSIAHRTLKEKISFKNSSLNEIKWIILPKLLWD